MLSPPDQLPRAAALIDTDAVTAGLARLRDILQAEESQWTSSTT